MIKFQKNRTCGLPFRNRKGNWNSWNLSRDQL